MKLLTTGLLVWILLAVVLAGCDMGAPAAATPATTDSDWGYTSKYLNTSYSGALSVMNQLVLGTMKLEGTANAVTPDQAKTLLPLWQSFQGSALRDNAERSAVLAAVENAMTPAQLQAIAALQLTGNDLQAWAQEQGLSFGPPGGGQGTPPAALTTRQAGGSGVDPTARAALRATAQAGGGFPGGQGGVQGTRGPRTGGSSGTGTSGALLNPLIVLLTQRAGGSADAARTPIVTPTPAQSPSAPTQTPTPTSEPTPTATPSPTQSSLGLAATAVPKSTPAASSSSTSSITGKLAFRGADDIIYVVNADGTGLHAVTAGIDPSWSPDGKKIAFVRWSEPWGLFVINSDGTGERQLISEKDLRQPDWSPKGDIIVVIRGRLESGGRGRQKWVGVLKGVNPDTGAYYEGDYPADRYVQSPSWAPDSLHLTFEGEQGINITAKSEDPHSLTPTLPESTYSTPAWSPQGDRIAYTREMHGYWEIWSMRTDGAYRWQLTPVSAPDVPAYNNVCPTWSPDGQYIAFLTDRSGKWEVWVMRADGSNQHKLLDLPVALTYGFNGDRMLDWTK